MRALSPALQAAIGSAEPLVQLELIDWAPHYAAVFSGGPAGRTGAVIAFDGALVQAYSDGAGHLYVRRVADPTQSSWGAWTQITASANSSGLLCLACIGDRLRLFWPDAATTQLFYADSTSNGLSWTAPATLFDPAAPLAGIAADGTGTQVFLLYQTGGLWRVALWTLGGSWTKADWTNGDAYAAGGLGAVRNADGSYLLAVALQSGTATGMALQVCSYTGTWSAPLTAVPADLGAGTALQDPHLAVYDGLYHLCYGLADSGSISGLASTRAALAHSLDGLHWSDPLEDASSYAHGAVALKHAAGYLLAAPDAAALAPPYSGSAAQYRDCTADLSACEVIQKDGAPARLVVTLQNDLGQYNALPALRPNACLRLSLGYAVAGAVPAFRAYIDDWSYLNAAGEAELVLTASDALAWLDRQSRATLVYGNQTVGWLAREIAARAGLLNVAIPGTAQFAQVVPTFSVPAGTTWRAALTRLSRLYGFDVAARTLPDGSDSLALVEKSPSDAPVWSYGAEAELRIAGHNADRANHVLVFGAPSAGGLPVGEAWDWADVGATGQERFLQVVEPQITTHTGAGIRATLELQREMRYAAGGSLSVALHPGLELWDVLTLAGVGPPATLRIATLHHAFQPGSGVYDLVLTLEGV